MAQEETCVNIDQSVDQSMTMSRGEKPDVAIDFSRIENMPVWDEYGQHVRFGDLYKDQTTIVIFIRHFLCYIAKEYVDDISLIPSKNLKAAGVRLVIIGCGRSKFVESFRRATGCKYEIFIDPECNIHKKFNLVTGLKRPNSTKESKHVKSNVIMGVLKSTWRGMQFREFQGDTNQQGGAFILGPGNQIHYQHLDTTPTDHAPLNDLLGLTGVEQVNFEKDARVMTI